LSTPVKVLGFGLGDPVTASDAGIVDENVNGPEFGHGIQSAERAAPTLNSTTKVTNLLSA
jgi:hypothetical protein